MNRIAQSWNAEFASLSQQRPGKSNSAQPCTAARVLRTSGRKTVAAPPKSQETSRVDQPTNNTPQSLAVESWEAMIHNSPFRKVSKQIQTGHCSEKPTYKTSLLVAHASPQTNLHDFWPRTVSKEI
jgi:hypothetical protein